MPASTEIAFQMFREPGMTTDPSVGEKSRLHSKFPPAGVLSEIAWLRQLRRLRIVIEARQWRRDWSGQQKKAP